MTITADQLYLIAAVDRLRKFDLSNSMKALTDSEWRAYLQNMDVYSSMIEHSMRVSLPALLPEPIIRTTLLPPEIDISSMRGKPLEV